VPARPSRSSADARDPRLGGLLTGSQSAPHRPAADHPDLTATLTASLPISSHLPVRRASYQARDERCVRNHPGSQAGTLEPRCGTGKDGPGFANRPARSPAPSQTSRRRPRRPTPSPTARSPPFRDGPACPHPHRCPAIRASSSRRTKPGRQPGTARSRIARRPRHTPNSPHTGRQARSKARTTDSQKRGDHPEVSLREGPTGLSRGLRARDRAIGRDGGRRSNNCTTAYQAPGPSTRRQPASKARAGRQPSAEPGARQSRVPAHGADRRDPDRRRGGGNGGGRLPGAATR
jgi:hypothetical protein